MRLIDADEIEYFGGMDCPQWTTAEAIAKMPEVKRNHIKKSRWVQSYRYIFQCERCGFYSMAKYNYCAECG